MIWQKPKENGFIIETKAVSKMTLPVKKANAKYHASADTMVELVGR